MVAKITVPNSIKRALNYNEKKVQEGVAKCIHANGFLKEVDRLNFYEKLHRFERLIALNKRATTNAVHVSLNFALNEKIEPEKLAEIASVYMQKIGFGDQPYLVYQHLDAAHPHIHIVSTNIQKDGKRISLHNLGRNQSTRARKEIEIAFGLVKAEEQEKENVEEIKPLSTQRIVYGKSPTKRGITNVLDAVLPRYKFASLAELNAVLKMYNITADLGKEDGVIFKNKGLVYRILDGSGNKVGVPIKASAIYNKPTLPYLEKLFKQNELVKPTYKKSLKTSIDWIMVKPPKTLEAFKDALQKEKINLVVRQNDNGIIYGLTFIDQNTKCVFNGSEIGKEYSARAILEKCGVDQLLSPGKTPAEAKNLEAEEKEKIPGVSKSREVKQHLPNLLEQIITPVEQQNYLPFELRKTKKKKRKPS